MAESATLSTYAATRRSLPEMLEAASRVGRDDFVSSFVGGVPRPQAIEVATPTPEAIPAQTAPSNYPYDLEVPQQQGTGLDLGTAWSIGKNFIPGLSGSGSGAAASTSGTAAGSGSTGAATGSGAAASGGSGAGSTIAAAGPWALLAGAIIGHNEWAKHKGLRDGEKFYGEYGLTGRALYKDKDYYREQLNDFIPGSGEDANIIGSLSSPADLFRSKTWDDIGSSLKQGGSVGALLKKIF